MAQVTDTHNVFGLKTTSSQALPSMVRRPSSTPRRMLARCRPDASFPRPSTVIVEPGQNSPVSVGIANATYGLYFADTLKLTDRLTATVSGRFNAAFVNSTDFNGGRPQRLAQLPAFQFRGGLTYEFAPWLTSMVAMPWPTVRRHRRSSAAPRPPTPAALSNFFVGDPDLRQVVAQTFEAGLRGSLKWGNDANLRYSLGFFRTNLDDDIAMVNSPTLGRAFFTNVGTTRRQGIEADLQYIDERWRVSLHYALVDATFQSGFRGIVEPQSGRRRQRQYHCAAGHRLPGIPCIS